MLHCNHSCPLCCCCYMLCMLLLMYTDAGLQSNNTVTNGNTRSQSLLWEKIVRLLASGASSSSAAKDVDTQVIQLPQVSWSLIFWHQFNPSCNAKDENQTQPLASFGETLTSQLPNAPASSFPTASECWQGNGLSRVAQTITDDNARSRFWD